MIMEAAKFKELCNNKNYEDLRKDTIREVKKMNLVICFALFSSALLCFALFPFLIFCGFLNSFTFSCFFIYLTVNFLYTSTN